MNARPKNLEALLGSRICHDLISPIGAIGNGLELISLTAAAHGPEMEMIQESVTNAQARIRFYRVAYGASTQNQSIANSEIRDVLSGIYGRNRLSLDWQADGEVRRDNAKLIFLLLQCVEASLPYGGTITVSRDVSDWTIVGAGSKFRDLTALWGLVTGAAEPEDLTPDQIQFALAALQADDMGRTVSVQHAADRIVVGF
ncbi:MAG: histidine phosphotransferase [Rhodobacteraceae bacterium]|nr:histidine phosphotransferase [Paracoccaceae bacterium]